MENSGNKWYVYKATVVAAVGGLLFGYDTAVVAGAIGFIEKRYDLSAAMVGWIASCALIGCIVGAMFAGKLSDRIGRKKVLILSAVLFAISSAGIAIPLDLNWFVFFRLIGGLGIGIASMLAPMYISEIAPAAIRGRLAGSFQVNIVLGILIAFLTNFLLRGIGDEAWRWISPTKMFRVQPFSMPNSRAWVIT